MIVTVTHDLTVKQKEELKDKIEEAREKERSDESGESMYWACRPLEAGLSKRYQRKSTIKPRDK